MTVSMMPRIGDMSNSREIHIDMLSFAATDRLQILFIKYTDFHVPEYRQTCPILLQTLG